MTKPDTAAAIKPRDRDAILQALRAGVHEFLIKPTSPQALRDRLTSILLKPRPMVKLGDFYVPEPRRLMAGSAEPEVAVG